MTHATEQDRPNLDSIERFFERRYRGAPLLANGEGTNELQRIIVARPRGARYPA